MHEQIDINQAVILRAVFVASTGALADPTNITLTVTKPDGTVHATVAKAALTSTATGKWQYVVTPPTAGMWTYRFVSSGVVDDTQDGYFLVGRAADAGGPCDPWLMPDDIFSCNPLDGIAAASRDYVQATRAVDAATRMLFRRTKSRYPGICHSTVRPCRRSTRWAFEPVGWNSTWGSCTCGSQSLRGCGCSGLTEVLLAGEYPLLGIERVRVDGSTLASSAYRVDDDRYLVRIDDNVWPSCQDLTADPASEANTWDVTFWYGRLAPPEGVIAAMQLAAQLYLACKGQECTLPSNLRSRTVQGISEELVVATDAEDVLYQIREVAWFLDSEKRADANRPSIVASPDFLPSVRRAGTA